MENDKDIKLSLIVPFKDEEGYAKTTIPEVIDYMSSINITYEIIAVDDSSDKTWDILKSLEEKYKNVKVIKGGEPSGFGRAIRTGFKASKGSIMVPFNGDHCDSIKDVLKYVEVIDDGYDMAFGSRYLEGSIVTDYPDNKLLFSKAFNYFLMYLTGLMCSDITNTFKGYSRKAVKAINPNSQSYEIGVEMSLRGDSLGLTYKAIPIEWRGRVYGESKMSIVKTMFRHTITAFRIKFGFR